MKVMAILIGVDPGGRNSFAVSALFWSGRLPAMHIGCRSYSGVDAVLRDISSVFGEWGELSAVAISAPLTWSGAPSGWRDCDLALRDRLPSWAPATWLRAPNTQPGAVVVQGPALAWALAREIKGGVLPSHPVVETHPLVSLARTMPDLKDSILGYRRRNVAARSRQKHTRRLIDRFVDAGIMKLESDVPTTAAELHASVAAIVALGCAFPDSGLVTHESKGGEIRPVGMRKLVILDALP